MIFARRQHSIGSFAALALLFLWQPVRSVRDLINDPQAISAVDVERVLVASRLASAGKSFRLTPLHGAAGAFLQLEMDEQARPRYLVADSATIGTSFEEFTGEQALTCDGRPLDDELVLAYARERGSAIWMAQGYPRRTSHTIAKYYEIYTQHPVSGELQTIDDRMARGFVVTEAPIAGNERTAQRVEIILWLDSATLLPLRWERVVDAHSETSQGWTFSYDPSLHLHPPQGVQVRHCVASPWDR